MSMMNRLKRLKLYYLEFGINGVTSAFRAKLTNSDVLLTVNRPGVCFPIYLKCGTSDIGMFDQIFAKQEYDFVVQKPPEVIVDAGANIGLASIFFANRYPDARIIAIEPESSNYEMLKMNVAPYVNIIPLHAVLWCKNEEIKLVDPGLGECGFMTKGKENNGEELGSMRHKVLGMTVDTIMEKYGLKRIDILKIDIEGAEREVFKDTSAWIEKIDALVIELHERMRPCCNRSFYNGSNGFDEEWTRGGDVCLSRKKYLTWGSRAT